MAYIYTDNTYLSYITSRLNPNKIFVCRPATGPMSGNEDYYTKSEAIEAAKVYDKQFLPMIPTTDASTSASNIITFKNYNGSSYSTVDLTNCVGTITVNTSAIPYGDPTLDDISSIENVIVNVQNKYNTADQLIISNPSDGFDTAILATLIYNINNAFSTDIPTTVGTYNYNKIRNRWELQE